MRRPATRRLLAIVAALIALTAFGVTPAAADHEGTFVGDIVLNIPDTFGSCLDEPLYINITTTGTGTRTLQGQIIVDFVTDAGRVQVPGGFYPVDQVGDLDVTITIPPVSEWPVQSNGTAEIHVDVQLGVFDEAGTLIGNIGPGHDFDIFCLTPPPPPPPDGDEGCTPGYWGRDQHLDSWVATGYAPGDSFSTVFGVTATGNPTLLQAVNTGGGGESALLRHATAALLNAASPDVDYPYSVSEVISMVQQAYASGDFESTKDLFEAANEAGCPLD
jgi:hypothetical protein